MLKISTRHLDFTLKTIWELLQWKKDEIRKGKSLHEFSIQSHFWSLTNFFIRKVQKEKDFFCEKLLKCAFYDMQYRREEPLIIWEKKKGLTFEKVNVITYRWTLTSRFYGWTFWFLKIMKWTLWMVIEKLFDCSFWTFQLFSVNLTST